MKLSPEVLLEIMAIVQDGLMGMKDASVGLRELDLSPGEDAMTLSPEYFASHPRAGTWIDYTNEEQN